MENNLPEALSNSIINDSVDGLSDVLELGIDAFLDDGIAKDIPLLSTVVGVYRVGKSVNELHLLKKLKVFVCAINNGIADEREREKYKSKIQNNSKQRQEELERLVILINRYVDYQKPEILAKLYLAYLDYKINWTELSVLAEILDKLFQGDIEILKSSHEIVIINDEATENVLRLISVGLVQDEPITISGSTISIDKVYIKDGKKIHKYFRTNLGDKFVSLLR